MQRRLFPAMLVAGLVTVLAGCSSSGVPYIAPAYHITEYWPISEGIWWRFRTELSGETWTCGVEEETEVGGTGVYPVRVVKSSGPEYLYLRRDAGGLYYHGWYEVNSAASYELEPPAVLPNGAKKNQPYTTECQLWVNGRDAGSITCSFLIVGTERVTTPAGDFDHALKVAQTIAGEGAPRSDQWWLVRELGPAPTVISFPLVQSPSLNQSTSFSANTHAQMVISSMSGTSCPNLM